MLVPLAGGSMGESMRGNRILAFLMMLGALILSACGSGYPAPSGSSSGSGSGSGGGGPSSTPAGIVIQLQAGVSSSIYTINAYVVDASNVAVSKAPVTFSVSPSTCGCFLSAGTATTDTTGLATTTLTANAAGSITVTATVTGTTVTASTLIVVSPGSSSGPSSTPASVLVQAQAASSGGYTINAYVVDASNVAVSNATVVFSVSPVTCGCVLSAAGGVTNGTGQASTSLAVNAAGSITITATVAGTTITNSTTITVPAAPNYQLGTLSGNTFTPGVINITSTSLNAGQSTGLQVTLYDVANKVPYNGSATVSFTSNCYSSSKASLVTPVTSTTGTFSSTYTAKGCAGNDQITASAQLAGSSSILATGTVTIASAVAGSLYYVPVPGYPKTTSKGTVYGPTIGLKGTGLNETQQITFQVLDTSGNGVAGVTVNFSLTTQVGGLSLSQTTDVSASDGTVSTIVQAGTVATPVRVIATATTNGVTLTSQSNQLAVSTGFPTQNGFSMSIKQHDIEGNEVDGQTTTVNVILSDRYGNPVVDGTAVSFTTEGGQIEPNCNTTGGSCSVTFTTASPRTYTLAAQGTAVAQYNGSATPATRAPCSFGNSALTTFGVVAKLPSGISDNIGCDDHRYTVLASAVGEESFNDCYGNEIYSSTPSSGCPGGDFFVALPEAWRDDNENGTRDEKFEPFFDFNVNSTWDNPLSSKFIGLLCSDPNCDPTYSSLNVFASQIIVMSSSTPIINTKTASTGYQLCTTGGSAPSYTVSAGTPLTIDAWVSDTAEEPMAAGTQIGASTPAGGISVSGSYTLADYIPNLGVAKGAFDAQLFVTSSSSATPGTYPLVISVTSSLGLVSNCTVNVTLN